MIKTFRDVINGKSIQIARCGKGSPLIFLHGYPENCQIWSKLAEVLSEQFEIITFDWPGMGRSEPWIGGATPTHMAERLISILDFIGIEKPIICGSDMGGQPALVFAAKYPDRISALIVMNSLVAPLAETSWEIAILRKFGWNRFLIRNFPKLIFDRAERTFLPDDMKIPEELRNVFWECFRQREVRSFISKMCAGYEGTLMQLPEFYSRILCPTLILWGEQDKHFPPIHAKFLHKEIPQSALKIIPGAWHWMVLQSPDVVAASILEFLKSDQKK